MTGVPRVVATRGGHVESVHSVAACVADARGAVRFALGDIDTPVYLRSSWKPFIAAAVVASGAADRFGFDASEVALVAASHNGEPFHVEAARSMLAKAGLDPSALQCGAHAPQYEPAAAALAAARIEPTALHNNCSGKHAGILAACVHLGFDTSTYLERTHPMQQRILESCARAAGVAVDDMIVGVDGCGIPVAAVSLRAAATAFARMASLAELEPAEARALARVRDAMAAQPAFVAGTGRFDTDLIVATGGAVVGKAGAEGVHADALLREGLGLALKVLDGARRAMPPATISVLGEVGAFRANERAVLEPHARPEIRNVAGAIVGGLAALEGDTIVERKASLPLRFPASP
jgi:L-asparaginase II